MGLEASEPTGDIEGIDADALLEESSQSTNRDVPMEAPKPDPEEAAKSQAAQEYELNVNGQIVKAPIDKLKQWAQQGYDYPQKMAELNKRQAMIDSLEKQYSPYKMIDEYAKTNPEWWQTVQSQFEATRAPVQHPQGNIDPVVQEKLQALEQFKQQYEAEREAKAREQQDSALTNEVQTIRKEFSNLDWSSLDQSGYSLEQRVLKHAMDNNIASFRAAFRDYNHENIVRLAQEKAKESLAKDTQKRTKLGLLGTSPTPTKGLSEAQGAKGKSYNDLLNEAKAELGIS